MSGFKLFLAFTIGAVSGGITAYYIARDHFDDELTSEVEKVKASYKEKYAETKKDIPVKEEVKEPEADPNEQVYDNIVRKQVTHYENYAKKYRTKSKGKPAADMDKLTKKNMLDMYEEGLEEEDFDEDEDTEMIYEEDDIFPSEKNPEPYSVDPQGKVASYSSYDKITLIWYSKDDILVFEDSDEEFVNPEDVLGDKWRKCVGQFGPDMAYIRNDNTETDYEIVREDRRYSGE